MDSYDNDWLFLDDDLFTIWVDDYLIDCREIELLDREIKNETKNELEIL